ncbi:putative colanic acid biosysnthesis UDP-glucose lipid carrier transferase [Tenacibaculum sp. MAR_2009_124]|uniref:exopolysaccharide biosynthesis polyprenyl glycosylphosphotransferase n=1 Tax=Tenacibaculum sp. MAR_2009_124 TaxID=1250059 RepID=UPI0008961F36|nr:exopolysaccharide biosynthesis polyprenyl glycosylphosphotransferase [Tenacibaculum sp. MAR_2009_124]SEC49004.1 putative colanic acid biosysnthesis UDP-glucose lipid carrier transferase [Tenacibaculum sp. MAR_2009_124]
MKKRYSKYIRALFLLLDLLVLNLISFFLKDNEYININFLIYISVFWIVSSIFTRFYKIYRYTSVYKIIGLLLTQLLIFSLGYFAYFSIFREGVVVNNQAKYLFLVSSLIIFFKFLGVYLLRKYRTSGKNYRKVIVLGSDNSTKKIIELFKNEKELGYIYFGLFSDRKTVQDTSFLGKIENSFDYIVKNGIDEIYCSLSELNETTIKKITQFASKNNRVVKLIPNANELSNKNRVTEYYGDSLRILKVKKMPFELMESKAIKRIFDIAFSIVVCIFVLSWLYPLLFVLIKLESRGPAIFKQIREGLHGGEFVCYKFRSMYLNDAADKVHTRKNDTRVTKVGAFLRRTSLDEFPQFFNVLYGSMSVVGPRPHLERLAQEYQKDVDNYIERHNVKPGITGLAQVSGYRGEIRKKADIKNRVRLDIFYIENWSLALDLKIIIKTIFNIFKGDEKAY